MSKVFLVVLALLGLIGSIRVNAPDIYDDMFFMHVNVKNEGTKNLEDLKVKVLIYDLGIMLQTNPFDLEDGNIDGKFVFWDTKSIKPGSYLARITVSNDDVRVVRHRYITIG